MLSIIKALWIIHSFIPRFNLRDSQVKPCWCHWLNWDRLVAVVEWWVRLKKYPRLLTRNWASVLKSDQSITVNPDIFYKPCQRQRTRFRHHKVHLPHPSTQLSQLEVSMYETSELTTSHHLPLYVATHFFGFQASRLPNIQCSVYDPCRMELWWKKTRSCRNR